MGKWNELPRLRKPKVKVEPTLEFDLPNGSTLFRTSNEVGGHTYISDEVGGGVIVWDTCLVSESTILAAIVHEHRQRYLEYLKKRKGVERANKLRSKRRKQRRKRSTNLRT